MGAWASVAQRRKTLRQRPELHQGTTSCPPPASPCLSTLDLQLRLSGYCKALLGGILLCLLCIV